MSTINPQIIYHVNRVECVFRDDLGNKLVIRGTGFWLSLREGDTVFVTNRHNLDPSIKLGANTKFQLAGWPRVEVRSEVGPNPTRFLDLAGAEIVMSGSADCALIRGMKIKTAGGVAPKALRGIAEEELADEDHFHNNLNILDAASFIGFPGRCDKTPWWDERFNIPIARTAWLAYPPDVPFEHPEIPTKDVSLVSGLSFAGSSGSPVFSHSKGINITGGKGVVIEGGVLSVRVTGVLTTLPA